jgi:hypothetical protein
MVVETPKTLDGGASTGSLVHGELRQATLNSPLRNVWVAGSSSFAAPRFLKRLIVALVPHQAGP